MAMLIVATGDEQFQPAMVEQMSRQEMQGSASSPGAIRAARIPIAGNVPLARALYAHQVERDGPGQLRQRRRIDPDLRFKLQALRPLDHGLTEPSAISLRSPLGEDRRPFAENPPGAGSRRDAESFGSSGSPDQTSRYRIMLAAIAAGVSSNGGKPIAAPRRSLMDRRFASHTEQPGR
jgi:hypothetical protein